MSDKCLYKFNRLINNLIRQKKKRMITFPFLVSIYAFVSSFVILVLVPSMTIFTLPHIFFLFTLKDKNNLCQFLVSIDLLVFNTL